MPTDDIQDLAGKWLAGTAIPAEIQRLQQWYHEREAMPTPLPDADMASRMSRQIHQSISHRKRPVKWISIAAGILVMLGAGWYYMKPEKRQQVAVYMPRERHDRLVLPDSSEVWLNADSKLSYSEVNNTREATLEGEAFFNIKESAGHPFIVKAGPCTATVLGTSFNIKAYKNDPKVLITVTTGKVQVQDNHQQLKVLTANRQITLEPITGVIREKEVNAGIYKAWIDDSFAVNNETFEEVANRLSRKYDVNISFDNPGLKQCTFIANFDQAATLPMILSMLCKINNSTCSISEDKKRITIAGKGCEQE